MKKILTAIVLFVFVALPMSVMAMSTMGDSDLSTVTGQAGVSIGADITMNVSFGTIAWGDSDGFSGATDPGWVGLKDGSIGNLRIHMRTDTGMIDATVGAAIFANKTALGLPTLSSDEANTLSILATNELLTIDVGTDSGKTKVRIGLPTFEIDMDYMTAKVGLWSDVTANDTFQEMGEINVSGMVMLLGKGNYVDISANNTASGVQINIGNTEGGNMIDKLTFASMSWGDSDSLGTVTENYGGSRIADGTTAHAGYIGLLNTEIDALKVTASLNINICTASGFATQALVGKFQDLEVGQGTLALQQAAQLTWARGQLFANDIGIKDSVAYMMNQLGSAGIIPIAMGTTAVDIQLSANVNIGLIKATAALGETPYLDNATSLRNVLGDLYISNLTVAIPAGSGTFGTAGSYAKSWVSISAH